MAEKKRIVIDNILGGHSPFAYFSGDGQFLSSAGIDPSAASDPTVDQLYAYPSGIIRPTNSTTIDTLGSGEPALWLAAQPKSSTYFVYDVVGSVYSLDGQLTTLTDLTDLNDGGSSSGNGMAYYDNYMYFSRDTTIARYGPLNSETPSWTDDYWVSTLGLTALENNVYPDDNLGNFNYPNHILHRHSDGRLYIADVVGNTGSIHYIQTTKTTVEGDTDNGSTYDKLNFGYGLWPTAMASYGENLVIALFEGIDGFDVRKRAKIAFWDTTSQKTNQITWVEYPDDIITSITNANGVLYFTSTNVNSAGFRVMQYVGGYSFREVTKLKLVQSPPPGATEALGDQLLFGSSVVLPFASSTPAAVYSLGLQTGMVNSGLFNIMKPAGSQVVSLCLENKSSDLSYVTPLVCSNAGVLSKMSFADSSYNNTTGWWSQIYRIGRPFRVTSVRIPLVDPMSANKELKVTLWYDSGNAKKELPLINNTNYPDKQNILIRPDSDDLDGLGVLTDELQTGYNNLMLELRWTSNNTKLCAVELPIVIDYELLPLDD